MNSSHEIKSYLKKRAISGPWKLSKSPKNKFKYSIVIPAYNEFESIFKALVSINKNESLLLKDTIVVVVVNNPEVSKSKLKNNNKSTIHELSKQQYKFNLVTIDASSKGLELPKKYAGVGLARRIGIDLCLPYMRSNNSLIFCTDADVEVSPKYLSTVINYFINNTLSAAVVGFKHKKFNIKIVDQGIKDYEHFLKSTAHKLKKCGSPYGYVAMGSTMVCTTKAYCAIGGMPKKKATEDFYFLQELAKYCNIVTIKQELVFPSSRPISRVYLGTGYRMEQIINGFKISNLYFSNISFVYLSQWIKIAEKSWKLNIDDLLSKTYKIHPDLNSFILNQGIKDTWIKIQANSKINSQFIRQFHKWFDGLKTIQFLKYFSTEDNNFQSLQK